MRDVELISGWHGPVHDQAVPFHWMEREARAALPLEPPLAANEPVFISVCAVDPGGDLGGPTLSIRAGGRLLGEAKIGSHTWDEYAFPLPPASSAIDAGAGRLEVQLAVDRWVPPKPGIDPREFGLAVHSIRLFRAACPRPPRVMELESTTACNINPPCVMCYPRANPDLGPVPPDRDLDDTLLEAARPGLEGVLTLSLHGIGEPLLSRQTRRLLEELGPRPVDIQFNTNGLPLTEKWARLLVERRLNRICFSIDAASPETYRRIRGNDLNRVVANIRRLKEIKEEQGTDRPLVEMNMTLMKANLNEAEAFIRLAAELGARYVVFGLLNEAPDYEVRRGDFVFRYAEQRLDERSETFRRTMAACRRLADELGVDLSIHTTEVPL